MAQCCKGISSTIATFYQTLSAARCCHRSCPCIPMQTIKIQISICAWQADSLHQQAQLTVVIAPVRAVTPWLCGHGHSLEVRQDSETGLKGDDIANLQRGRHEEELLLQAELLSVLCGVIGVEDSTDVLCLSPLLDCLQGQTLDISEGR